MEGLKQLHTAVAQTFENCFDTAYRNLNAELAAYDARVKDADERTKAANEACKKTAYEADVLRHEVSLLRDEMRQGEIDSKESRKATERELQLDEIYEPRCVLGDRNRDVSDIDRMDIKRISDRYTELYEQARMLVQASAELKRLVKQHKRKLERLGERLQRQEFTFIVDGKVAKFQRVETTEPVNISLPPEFSPPSAIPLKGLGRDLGTNMSTRKSATLTSEVARKRDDCSAGDECDSTGEKGQGEHTELTSTLSDASTDELPHTTSAATSAQIETLKRKRAAPEQSLPKGNLSSERPDKHCPDHPIMVKSETMSSSPLGTYSSDLRLSGTQDLDDIGDTVVTPTKRVRFNRDQGSYALPENLPTTMGSPSAQQIARTNRTHGVDQFSRDGPRVLQPINGNLRNSSGPGQMLTKRGTKGLGSVTRISSITEDGDENRPPVFARRGRTKARLNNQSVRDPSSGHRLSDLLEGTLPASRMFQLGATSNTSACVQHCTSRSSERGSSLTNRSELDTTSTAIPAPLSSSRGKLTSSRQDGNTEVSHHQSERMSQMEAMPDDEPYRARPPQRLNLEHFRINPDYNNGLDYAYDNVIRRKDERKCASGCTRPGCCGEKFLAMARFGIPMDISGKTLSDNEILEEYLGDDKNIINTLSSGGRENLLVEAKARVFADRFGRHRHQHHKPGTPPGFWRTEMPGTQELEEDREGAQSLEREKVKERYREAMRPDGRWIFADE